MIVIIVIIVIIVVVVIVIIVVVVIVIIRSSRSINFIKGGEVNFPNYSKTIVIINTHIYTYTIYKQTSSSNNFIRQSFLRQFMIITILSITQQFI